VIGPLGFGFNNSGESIRLFKPNSVLYKGFTYSSKTPWPTSPNGTGYTLELTSTSANQNIGSSWTTGCPGGSPGTQMITPCTTPVFKPANELTLNVYPNPSKGFMNIVLPAKEGIWKIEVLDVFGFIQHAQVVENKLNEISLDLSDLKSGVYTLRASLQDDVYQTRIVLVK
jgi:hypothetical protein